MFQARPKSDHDLHQTHTAVRTSIQTERRKKLLQALTDKNAELLDFGAKMVDIVKSVWTDREAKEDILQLAR